MKNYFTFIAVLRSAPVSSTVAATFLVVPDYRSLDDNPFDLSGLGETFFVEDFEDSEQFITEIHGASVRTQAAWLEGGVTGVVGPDDRFALEANGYALHPVGEVFNFKYPQDSWTGLQFDFHSDELGFLPTAVGFVRTYTETVGADLTIEAFGPNGELLSSTNQVFDDETATPFIGVTDPQGISRLIITSHTESRVFPRQSAIFSIDHFQYGIAVPEPGGACLALVMVLCLLDGRCTHRCCT